MEVTETKKKFGIKFILLVLTLIAWVTTIILKITTEISIGIMLVISILITIALALSFIFKKIAENKKAPEKTPEPLSEEKVKQKVEQIILNRWNYIEGEPTQSVLNINSNIIYYHKVNLDMEEKFGDKIENSCWVIINATFPNILPCVREGSLKEEEIKLIANNMSKNPKDEPIVEVSEESIDPFGKPTRKVTRRTPLIENNEEEKEV